MFSAAALVFKRGELIVRDGRALGWRHGTTSIVAPETDPLMERRMADYYTDRFGVGPSAFAVPEAAFGERDIFRTVPCQT